MRMVKLSSREYLNADSVVMVKVELERMDSELMTAARGDIGEFGSVVNLYHNLDEQQLKDNPYQLKVFEDPEEAGEYLRRFMGLLLCGEEAIVNPDSAFVQGSKVVEGPQE